MKDESKKTIRIISICGLVLLLLIAGLNTFNYYKNPPDEKNVDSNIYLNEEVCFAKEVYISVIGINVEKEEETYYLHLLTNVIQRCEDNKPDKILIEPKNFVLKSVNLKAKSQMSVFFECLFKASVSVLVSGAVEGSVNVIEETISFIGDYTSESISNAVDKETKFKKVKANDTFESFYPRDKEEATILDLVFPLSVKNLEQTDNIIVLTIDQFWHIERRIFLITRPEGTVPS